MILNLREIFLLDNKINKSKWEHKQNDTKEKAINKS